MRRRDDRRRPRTGGPLFRLLLGWLVLWGFAGTAAAQVPPPVKLRVPGDAADPPAAEPADAAEGEAAEEDGAEDEEAEGEADDDAPAPKFFTDDCDEDCATNWRATAPGDVAAALVALWPDDGLAGQGCAQALWVRAPADAVLRFDRAVPPSKALDELAMSLAVKTPHRCAAAVRVTFPNAVDPITGLPPTAWIAGAPQAAGSVAEWRTLSTGTTTAALNDARRRVRLALGPDPDPDADEAADLTGAVVDRAGVLLWTDGGAAGRAGVRADDLRLGPLVAAEPVEEGPSAGLYAEEPERRMTIAGGRVTVDGDPFFPRVTFTHRIDPAALVGMGINLVQVPDWRDRVLLDRIAEVGLGAVAQPPEPGRAGAGPADLNRPDGLNEPADAGLAPFGRGTDPIWLWNLGPRIPGEPAWVRATSEWADAVRAADKDRDRPILLGVTGSERAYSRVADLLGVSRMVLGTALPLWEHTALLREVADRKARPGEPLFTWLQTAPHTRTAAARAAAGLRPAVLEPELIERQVFGALAAGVRGIGYWITEPLDDATPARTERRLAITLSNLQIDAVEPILAAATKIAPLRVVPATTGDPRAIYRRRGGGATNNLLAGQAVGGPGTRGVGAGGSGAFGGRFGRTASLRRTAAADVNRTGASDAKPAGRATGAVLTLGADRLVVATWHGANDQFVPGPAPFTSAAFTVPGALITAAAYRVTPTAVESLPYQQVTGGMRVTVPNFGDGAVVLVTPNQRGVDHLRRRVAKLAPGAATAAVHLARLKVERTRDTDAKLRPPRFDGRWYDAHLYAAEKKLRDAEGMLQRHEWDRARAAANLARRFARAVQRAHWDRLAEAVKLSDQPNASPHLIAFSTLPDHVALVNRLTAAGRGRTVALLPDDGETRTAALPLLSDEERDDAEAGDPADGDEDRPAFDGRVYYGAPASVDAAAVLDEGSLRLSARPKRGYDPPSLLERGLVVVQTAPVDVPAGYGAVVRGEIKITGRVTGNGEGVTVHDSWAEELGGLRWTGEEESFGKEETGGWTPFVLLRPLPPAPGREPRANADGSRPITVTFGLHGLGSAQFRGVTVETVPLGLPTPPAGPVPAPAPLPLDAPVPAPMPRALDRLSGVFRRS